MSTEQEAYNAYMAADAERVAAWEAMNTKARAVAAYVVERRTPPEPVISLYRRAVVRSDEAMAVFTNAQAAYHAVVTKSVTRPLVTDGVTESRSPDVDREDP